MINWLDFKSIKRSVPLEPVLRHYNVKLRRSGINQYRGCCPIHHGDGRDAFHVNLARNIFHCFACGAGGTVLDFVAAMEGCTIFEAAQRLQFMCSTTPFTLTPNEKELVTERRRVCLPLDFTLTGIEYSHPYLAERGITEKTALEFGVGFYAGPGLDAWAIGHSYPQRRWGTGRLLRTFRGSDATALPRPTCFCQIGDPFQHASRHRPRRQYGRRSGGILRLHESAPGWLPVGRRADGSGSL